MPGSCGTPDVQGRMLSASLAVAELWLAVTFQPLSTTTIFGSDASISATVHGVLRLARGRADARHVGRR